MLAGLGLELPGRVPTSRAASPPALLTTTVTRPDPARGIFETVLVAGGAPVALDAHLARLRRSALALRGTAPAHAGAAAEGHALAREGAAAARIIAVPDPAGGWTVTVMARPAPAPLTGPVELVPVLLPGGLGEHKWADREALNGPRRGASWLLCDRGGEVLEAAWANVWLREGDTVVTPPVDGRLLPGTRRAAILADPASAGALRAAVERVDLDRLRRADAVLLSSALRIVPAAVALPAGSRRGAVSSRH
ncbi:MAG: aminotransferase class IV [Baekduiaceae bacterium]